MKTIFRFAALLTILSVFFFSCQKEVSFEIGDSSLSVGSLQVTGTAGCQGVVVSGFYKKDTALNASNYTDINVQVDSAGFYLVTTDTVNGYYFRATGNFTSTGVISVRLVGNGKPLTSGINIFTVRYNGTICEFSVTVAGTNSPDYYPRTTYSNWSYQFDGVSTDSLLIKVIPQTLAAAGKTYNIFVWTDGSFAGFDSSGYYRKSGNDYFEWIDMGSYIGFDNPLWVEYNFLKDNLSAGSTWFTPGFSGTVTPMGMPPVSVTARFFYTIIQQNVSVMVNNVNYANTIIVKQELQQLVSGNWVTSTAAGYLQNYYARDIGLIKQDYYNNTGALSAQMDVRRLVVY